MSIENGVVIIGAGQAGCMAAIALRQFKYKGTITLIGKENHLPYQRPPLSKGFLMDKIEEESLLLRSMAYYKNRKIKIFKNKTVVNIDRDKKTIILDDQFEQNYQQLILTTGSNLKKLKFSCNTNNLHYLRNIKDALEIKSTLNNKKNIAILGAGYIGLEIAAAAIKKKLEVTVVEMESTVMSRSVCSETSAFFLNKHEKMGVKFKLNTSIRDIKDHNNHKKIIFNDGTIIFSDAVVIGVGIKPNLKLALESGLKCNNGIIVDEHGQTSDKNIFASGDCTNHPNKILNTRLRLESVQNAVEQSKSVAAYITGVEKPYNQVPWFWSINMTLSFKLLVFLKTMINM